MSVSEDKSTASAELAHAMALFDAEDGDLIIECTADATEDGAESCTFKVHRQKLAHVSTFFEDMLEVANDQRDGDERLPRVRMEEHWRIVQVLLGWAYNKQEIVRTLSTSSYWLTLLQVFTASNKYYFHTLAPYTSMMLRFALPGVDSTGALNIYSRACLFGDKDLASTALPRAVLFPLKTVPLEILRELPPSGLQALIHLHCSRTRKEIDSIRAAYSYSNKSYDVVGRERLAPLERMYPE